MDTNDNASNEFKDQKPQYVALAKQLVDSEFMVTVGVDGKLRTVTV